MLLLCQRGQVEFMGGGGDGGGTGDGDPDPANTGEPNGGGAGGDGGSGGQAGKINYHSDLGEEFHGNKTLLKYYSEDKKEFNLGATQKALIHATSMIGKDQVAIPDKNSTDDQRRAVQYKLGLPEDYANYGMKNNLPEGLTENKEFFEGLSKKAHELGILPHHAQALFDHYNNAIGTETTKANEAYTESAKNSRALLEKEYGEKFNQKMEGAAHAMGEFASEEEMASLKEAGFVDNPIVAKIFVKIHEAMNTEDTFDSTLIKKESMDPAELEAEIAEFRLEINCLIRANASGTVMDWQFGQFTSSANAVTVFEGSWMAFELLD